MGKRQERTHLIFLDAVQLLQRRFDNLRYLLLLLRCRSAAIAGDKAATIGQLRCGGAIDEAAVLLDAQMISWRRHGLGVAI